MLLPFDGCGSANALAAVIGAPPAFTHKRLRLKKVRINIEVFIVFRSLLINIPGYSRHSWRFGRMWLGTSAPVTLLHSTSKLPR
jgi:hypothetical protein